VARRKKLADRFLDPREGELRTHDLTQTTGTRKGLGYDEVIRGGRVFNVYKDDMGTGLGKEVVEVKAPGAAQRRIGTSEPTGSAAGQSPAGTPKLSDKFRRGVTASGRVVHQRKGGKRLVMNEEQTQAALRKHPELRRLLKRRGNTAA
jgi:hypothetical protein